MGHVIPQCTLEQYQREFADRHLVHGAIAKWAAEKPDDIAVVYFGRDQPDSWRSLDQASSGLAMQLLRMGLRKGDFLATSLPFLREHLLLEYACFKIGVIHAPLDLRLSPEEVMRSLSLVRAKGFAFLGQTRAADFRELGRAVQRHCPFVRNLIQVSPLEETIDGAHSIAVLAQRAVNSTSDLVDALREAGAGVKETDGAQVIFTTGSTGEPKPALLSHRSITSQNMCLGAGMGFDEKTRMLVNFPPSHVAGQSETLMTTLFHGGRVILLDIFDAARSLEAIQEHRVDLIGQIPAMFQMEWKLSGYSRYDLTSLKTAVYGGQQVPMEFLRRMATMAPRVATGLGLTEASGFCTYTRATGDVEEVARGIGYDMPIYPMTIRKPMREDGRAGGVLPDGETGHVCFQGPQTFLGYVNSPEATRKTISADRVLYTGDLGHRDQTGLHFAGRSKWVIKPAGYQVFPAQVENHFCALEDKVAACGAVGVEHERFSEGIVAFVEKRSNAELSVADLKRHARSMTGYMRPHHYVILEPGSLPLNRVAKTDYVRLSEMASKEVEDLRRRRKWDR